MPGGACWRVNAMSSTWAREALSGATPKTYADLNPSVTIYPAHFAWEAFPPRGQLWTRARLHSFVPVAHQPLRTALSRATDGIDRPA